MGDTFPTYKAAVAQASPVFLDRAATIEKTCSLMIEAGKNEAKLIAFPEVYIPGYPYWIWLDVPQKNYDFFKKLFKEAIVIPSPETEELCRCAKEADICAVIGANEKDDKQMGTMWNTNIIISNEGKLLGKHRKIVPSFAEKMVWSRGDGSMLRVWQTDIGRVGTLACGNNFHSLYRYALIAQGEQVHVGNYPGYYQPNQVNHPLWNRVRTAYHSIEGTLFNLCSTSPLNDEMIEVLSQGDEKKKEWLEACKAYSCITNPIGETLCETLESEELIYADIDISEMIAPRQYFDTAGHYSRMDVVSLNLCIDEDKPVHFYKKNYSENLPRMKDPLTATDLPIDVNIYEKILVRLDHLEKLFSEKSTN
jgi:predicted amidohydrolase